MVREGTVRDGGGEVRKSWHVMNRRWDIALRVKGEPIKCFGNEKCSKMMNNITDFFFLAYAGHLYLV